MEFGEMKRNTWNWSNFCMLPCRAGLSASAGLSCISRRRPRFMFLFSRHLESQGLHDWNRRAHFNHLY